MALNASPNIVPELRMSGAKTPAAQCRTTNCVMALQKLRSFMLLNVHKNVVRDIKWCEYAAEVMEVLASTPYFAVHLKRMDNSTTRHNGGNGELLPSKLHVETECITATLTVVARQSP